MGIKSILHRIRRKVTSGGYRPGYGLVAMAVFLVIVGAVAIRLQSKAGSIDNSKDIEIQGNLKIISLAIANFKGANGRIPCPAPRATARNSATYGIEWNCATAVGTTGITDANGARFGALPFITLNLPEKYAIDPWGNKIMYAMVKGFGNAGTYSGTTGLFTVTNYLVGGATATAQSAVILSHGKTAEGAYAVSGTAPGIACGTTTSLDVENCNDDLTFNNAAINPLVGTSFFDDVIYFVKSY